MKFINKDLYISISKCVLWWSLEIWNTTVNLKVNRLILTAEWKCVDQFEASNPPICTQTRATFSGVWTFEDWFLQIPAQHWVFRCPTQVPELIRDVLCICSRERLRNSFPLNTSISKYMYSARKMTVPVQIPHPTQEKFKFSALQARTMVKCPVGCLGGGCCSFEWISA